MLSFFFKYTVYLESVSHTVLEGHLTLVSQFKILPQIVVQVCVIVISYVRFYGKYIKYSQF